MSAHADTLRRLLAHGPRTPRQLLGEMAISQPTLSRALAALGPDLLRIGAARSIHYALRDNTRGLPDIPIDRVDPDGRIRRLGTLIPTRGEGFVMQESGGGLQHHEGLPWWLLDMRPQGFLGRAFAGRHAGALGLPSRLSDWNDTHMLRALLAQGHDAVGNLLLGADARERFLHTPAPTPIGRQAAAATYARLAEEAARGGLPGSSAGGEQPKFTTYVETPEGPCHVLVKFSLTGSNPLTSRWRDLLLAEHHALETLRAAGLAAARSRVIDGTRQRFLEIERFDRVGPRGRRAVLSLAALEAEFVGQATAPWPVLADELARQGHVTPEAAESTALLYAFGTLIGNTDMHHGNLSFAGDVGGPWTLAPAYDMLPMGFSPQSSGALPDALLPARLHEKVLTATWQRARELAVDYQDRLRKERRFSREFAPCRNALARHLTDACERIERLG